MLSEKKQKDKTPSSKMKNLTPTLASSKNLSTHFETVDEYFSQKIKKEIGQLNQASSMEIVNKNFQFLKKIERFDKSDANFNKMMLFHQKKYGIGNIKSEYLFDKREKEFQFVPPRKSLTKEIKVNYNILL